MKIKCPHCSQTLSLSDDKLREYLPDDAWAEGDSQPGRQVWIMIIVVAVAIAGMVGFGGGALLTRPTRNRTADKIESVRATAAEEAQQATRTAEQATAKTRQLEAQVKALYLRIANLTKENQEAWATVKEERTTAQTTKPPAKPNQPRAGSDSAVTVVSTPFFGVYLGESINVLRMRLPVKQSPIKDEYGKDFWQVRQPGPEVEHMAVSVYKERVCAMILRFSDTTKSNYNAIKKELATKYGDPQTGGLSDSLLNEAIFQPVIDGVMIDISLEYDKSFGGDDTLTLIYQHGDLVVANTEDTQNRKADRVKGRL